MGDLEKIASRESSSESPTIPTINGISAIKVTNEQLLQPRFVEALEKCFLQTLATYVTDRVIGENVALFEPLEDPKREEVARDLGEYFVQHCRQFNARSEANRFPTISISDEDTIKGIARYITSNFGNTYQGSEATGAFAVEYQRALTLPDTTFFICAMQENNPDSVLGLMTAESYALPGEGSGLYLRELMIIPEYRSGAAVRTILENVIESSSDVKEVTIATRAKNAEGDESKTLRLYRAFGFRTDESPLTENYSGKSILAQHDPIRSQSLDSEIFVAMKTDLNSLIRGLKRFQAFFA